MEAKSLCIFSVRNARFILGAIIPTKPQLEGKWAGLIYFKENAMPNNPNTKLRTKREAKHWGVGEVASKIGVDRHTYQYWEQGKHQPQFRLLEKLCALFECKPVDLF
jgi:DNA-binding XRE family transcriptional regulator